MNKGQGRTQAGAVPVRQGGDTLLQGGTLCYVVKCLGPRGTLYYGGSFTL